MEGLRRDQSNKPPLNSPMDVTDVHRIFIERTETGQLLAWGGEPTAFVTGDSGYSYVSNLSYF